MIGRHPAFFIGAAAGIAGSLLGLSAAAIFVGSVLVGFVAGAVSAAARAHRERCGHDPDCGDVR